jgi:uncharacterized membrane protein
MDTTHLHLLLNHFPIIGGIIGTILLAYSVLKKDIHLQKVSLILLFVMALIAIPVFLTGEPAEESVEHLPGVSESIIEEHEEAGEIAFWVMMFSGALAIITYALISLKLQSAKLLVKFALLLNLASAGLMARAGYLGGQIRHTEIRGDAGTNVNTETGSYNNDDEEEENED